MYAKGKAMEPGDVSRSNYDGTQIRHTGRGVRLEIWNLKQWRRYKAAWERKHPGHKQPDLPLAPSLIAAQERARANLAQHAFKGGQS